jgi:hypothetical protein
MGLLYDMRIGMYKHDDASYNDLIKKVPCRVRRVTMSWPTGAADFRLGLWVLNAMVAS